MKILDYKYRQGLALFIRDINVRGAGFISKVIASVLLPRPKHEIIIKTKHNFNLLIDPSVDDGVEKSLYSYGTYEYGILKLMGYILRKGDVFIDVGANIGLMSIHASSLVGETGKVYSFEAHPHTVKILQKNALLNDVKNVNILQKALGAEKSKGQIYSNLHINRGGASLVKPDVDSECFDVEVVRFDDFYNEASLQAIRLVKIDIEGFELEALKGFGNIMEGKDAPVLIVECSELRKNYESSTEDLLGYIKEINNYHVYKLEHGKERFSKLVQLGDELPKHDNIICFLQDHISEMDERLFNARLR